MDAAQVWCGTQLGVIVVYSAATGSPLKELRRHKGGVTCIVPDAEGHNVWSAGLDFTIIHWNSQGVMLNELHGHTAGVLWLIPMGPRIWSGSEDGTVKVWTIGARRCINTIRPLGCSKEGCTGVAATCAVNAGDVVLCGYEDGSIRSWAVWGDHELVAEVLASSPC